MILSSESTSCYSCARAVAYYNMNLYGVFILGISIGFSIYFLWYVATLVRGLRSPII